MTFKPYRIAIIQPSAGIHWSGGTGNFAIELSQYLSSFFEVELMCGNPSLPHAYPAGGISRTRARKLIQFLQLNVLLRKMSTNPEIVIEHATNFFPCLLHLLRQPADLIFPCNSYGGLAVASIVRSLLGTPILYKSSNGLLGEGKILARDLKFRPDHLVAFSQEIEDFARQVRPEQSVSTIPNGVDLQKFNPDGKRIDLGLPTPIILCVASLSRKGHKRVELAIQAVAQVPEASLFVCGDGADRDYYQTMGNTLLGAHRFAIKTFPFDQMPLVYRSADVFTLCSYAEPFGTVYLQAMASGLPIVCTDNAMSQYIMADAGILCDVTDVEVYAAALRKALTTNWQSKVIKNVQRFSWETVAKSYRDLMLRMIENQT